MFEELFHSHRDQLEDFWERRANAPAFETRFSVSGWPVRMTANREDLLQIAALAGPLYSRAPDRDEKAWQIQFVVREPLSDPGLPPDDLVPSIRYTGSRDWIHLDLAGWGSAFADLRAGWGVAILAPSLAAQPELVTRAVVNTLLTNFLTRHGFAMLHATGLVDGDRILMLMAPHNSGKSTTALRLALSGRFRLLCDSMIYVTERPNGLQLTGFPVGRGKLRSDMLPHFPQLEGMLSPEQVRTETKYVLDLHALDPSLVLESAFYPKQVDWFLVQRSKKPQTTIRPASIEQAWEWIVINSLHDDAPEVWMENLALIRPLVDMARFHHLELGAGGSGVVEQVMGFWERGRE